MAMKVEFLWHHLQAGVVADDCVSNAEQTSTLTSHLAYEICMKQSFIVHLIEIKLHEFEKLNKRSNKQRKI